MGLVDPNLAADVNFGLQNDFDYAEWLGSMNWELAETWGGF